jgi:hypothetical protein
MRRAKFDAGQVQDAVTNAVLRDDFLGKFAHALYRSLEHHGFDALIMIEMGVHCRDGQVVVGMLDARQPLRQFALVKCTS